MHRLVIRAVEEFLRDTYGAAMLSQVIASCNENARSNAVGSLAGPKGCGCSAEKIIPTAAILLKKPPEELFEDLGAWLASREAIRRLLRFSGRDFEDFVISLEELPGRAHFVIPELCIPRIDVHRQHGNTLRLVLPSSAPEWTAMLAGLLRAMADDYGTLGLIDVEGSTVVVQISDQSFAEGRDFSLDGGQAAERSR
ncbi:heme NO-binding domain-containing protein [Paracoccus salsus]|uniref:heme NO-binding domain-containing protein n=1 Tax=Paracoccus salsus TaxID=2911061 RepID=UPI001F3658BB|nr:heme NO-binding domain-containing protein [Paracoccus salsus]MCF3974578.1 heme NO-binding domain-containing protein [Paracoccus salsus]